MERGRVVKDKLCLFFCDYFQKKSEWILEQETDKDIKRVFYRYDCDHLPKWNSYLFPFGDCI